ncbi:FAD-binding oxidoreductase [Shewanella schlegeliana]|uniref:FAD-binding oxidoreductase n=1 Tax=Shewanella schlegeliana TaxID=190308 RepID=A0ABS1SZL8_9GAMM|nr:FAD-binding oxidoreductase [Shewanella schlegeliana]MBL4913976.1 FAD-binding oxidoreductase [Shewanella schlegeliana]MCL1108640.1 FAD-binding oxidoreductase [Shewanella schlegeliana]GIU35507.1 4-cresol dehydrogenase [Shewanella schlegeliana]
MIYNDNRTVKQVLNIESFTEHVSQATAGRVVYYDALQAKSVYGANTIATDRDITGAFIVLPIDGKQSQTAEEENISTILRLAGKYQITLYPISSGNNWGYGSANPVDDVAPCFILDLSKLKRIEINAQLGIVRLQPGVTQQELRQRLDRDNLRLMVPVTGAGPTCSLVGNAIERGYGITPNTDHFAAVTSITAVLADGSVYRSAVHSLDQTAENTVDSCYKWGLGPYLDGLFSQSNLGVVTDMTIRLAPLPECVESFYLFCVDDKALESVATLVRKILKDFPGIVGSINILDCRRMLSMVVQPSKNNHMNDLDYVERLQASHKVYQWTCMGSLYGNHEVVQAVKRQLKKRIKEVSCVNRSVFISTNKLKVASKVFDHLPQQLFSGLRKQLAALQKSTLIMRGVPCDVALPLAYWRNDLAPTSYEALNPARDNCGLLWYAPLIPVSNSKIREFVDMVRSVCPKYGVEPLITMTALRHDCIDSTIPLLFNRRDAEAIKNAKRCLDELFMQGCKRGFVPYRLNVEQQLHFLSADDPHWTLVRKIKQAMDPNNIIAPKRYNP